MKIIVLESARQSLERSLLLLSKSHSRTYLRRLIKEVHSSIKWLAQHPGAGQIETELEWLNLGHRRIIAGPFKVIYRINNNMIIVNDIFDTRRDPREIKR